MITGIVLLTNFTRSTSLTNKSFCHSRIRTFNMPIVVPRNDFNLLRIDSACSSSEIESGASKNKNSSAQHVQAAPAPRRRVVFNRDVYVQETIHVNDYSDDEMDATWYTRDDFKNQKAEFAITVRMLATNRYSGDDDIHCARGLEYRHREGAKERQKNKLNGLMSVLEEQERQQLVGEENDEKISQAYVQANYHCRHAALEMGLFDEDEVFGPMDDSSYGSRASSMVSQADSEASSECTTSGSSKQKAGLGRFFKRTKK
jgi:hypothetical protein